MNKEKTKKLQEILERHHRGTLPKCYYSPSGKLFPHNFLYGERRTICEEKDRKKTVDAYEKIGVVPPKEVRKKR